jgi:hypothetical protein
MTGALVIIFVLAVLLASLAMVLIETFAGDSLDGSKF